MFIYKITIRDDNTSIYIGKTNNFKHRMYSHKSATKTGIKNHEIYIWLSQYDWDKDVIGEIIEECSDEEADAREQYYINWYMVLYPNVYNRQLSGKGRPLYRHTFFNEREELWQDYVAGVPNKEIIEKYNISGSLLSKIIQEKGGSPRKPPLWGKYEEIQQRIMNGESIHGLAREYGVVKNAIKNINDGITAYNPELSYPLNDKVRDEVMRKSRFKKSKV